MNSTSLSTQFQHLFEQLEELRRIFNLDNYTSEIDDIPREQEIYCKAYSLLAHAEIEHYFEEICRKIALSAKHNWDNQRSTSITLLSIILFSEKEKEPPHSLKPPQQSQEKKWRERIDFSEKIKYSFNAYIDIINNNNGVKEKNILSLLLPIGIKADDINEFFLAILNDFGTKRGRFAHTTNAVAIKTNPKDEIRDIEQILTQLKEMDKTLMALLS